MKRDGKNWWGGVIIVGWLIVIIFSIFFCLGIGGKFKTQERAGQYMSDIQSVSGKSIAEAFYGYYGDYLENKAQTDQLLYLSINGFFVMFGIALVAIGSANNTLKKKENNTKNSLPNTEETKISNKAVHYIVVVPIVILTIISIIAIVVALFM